MRNRPASAHVHAPAYRIAAWVGLILILMTTTAALAQGRGGNSLFLVGTMVVVAAAACAYRPFPALFSLFVVFAALLSAVGWSWNLYSKFVPYDEITHGISTMAVTLGAAYAMHRLINRTVAKHPWITAALLISVGVAVGAAWEVIEYYFIVPAEGMTLHDTITDLIVDTVGAIAGAVLNFWTLGGKSEAEVGETRSPAGL